MDIQNTASDIRNCFPWIPIITISDICGKTGPYFGSCCTLEPRTGNRYPEDCENFHPRCPLAKPVYDRTND